MNSKRGAQNLSIGKLKTSKVVVWAAAATLTVLVISAIFWPYIMTFWNATFGPGPGPKEKFIYSGSLKINLPVYNSYDDSTYKTSNATVKIFHADKTTLFASTSTSAAVTGEILPEDNGILYMVLDSESDTTEYVYSTRIKSANSYVTEEFQWDYDSDGIIEYGYKLDFTSLTPLAAGESQKEVTLNQYYWLYDAPAATATSTINATSASLDGGSYLTLSSEGYLTGVAQGYGFKIVKVELTFPNAGNATYYDTGKVKNVQISLGYGTGKVWTWTQFQSRGTGDLYLTANIGVTDITQEYYGKLAMYERNAGATVFSYRVQIQGANFASTASWKPTLVITYINPAGTPGTVSRPIAFTDTS